MKKITAIESVRRRAGLSQVQLAKRLGWTQNRISLLESGQQKPTPKDLEQIEIACGLDENAQKQ